MVGIDYAVITPARDEADNLGRLAESLTGQSIRPRAWVIVDSGSADRTPELAGELAARHSWIRTAKAVGERSAEPGAPIVRAFHTGLRALDETPSVIVKVDADVALPPTYFAELLREFHADPLLGIAGGRCYELESGSWQPAYGGASHVRGAVRAYRAECLEQLLPLPERTGWDTVDELQANVHGWTTRVIPELRFDHYRSVGQRDGGRSKRWRAKGEAAHYLGYRPLYLLLRALFWTRRDPAAVAMIWGFTVSALHRRARHHDPEAREHLRRRQRLRNLRTRARETTMHEPPGGA